MKNTLSFASVYKSLYRFETVDLPQFVVLTGRNGSGKSHLLEAIRDGKIRSTLITDPVQEVRLFTATSIVPKDTGVFDPAHEQSQRSKFFRVMEANREISFPKIQSFAISKGIPPIYCSSIHKIASLDVSSISEFFPSLEKAEQAVAEIQRVLIAQGSAIYSQSVQKIGDPNWKRAAEKLSKSQPQSFLTDSQSGFFERDDYVWGEVDPFQQAFARVFSNYRELIRSNYLLEKFPPPPEDPGRRYLLPEDFVKTFGQAPWDFVNQILEECHLDFRVNSPPMHETSSYEPKLLKLSSEIEMRFQDLSSGEKVLMSFALCFYNAREGRQSKVFPKLLLLDEVDAPLHPSMTVSLLQTIQNVLVRDRGVSVILTTHSPSTVALSPEDAIYSMDPSGPRIEKVTRGSALSILTAGVPTLAISFDGRRQIFVESRSDANLYELLYQRYKGYLHSDRSLIFVEVGRKNDSGKESNGGCDQVIRFVEALTEGGNQSVLGLVDWDGWRNSTTRIHVLCPQIRNGIESLLLDPRLLVAAVAREDSMFAKQKAILDSSDTYLLMKDWGTERWQRAVDKVQDIVLRNKQHNSEMIDVSYIDGIILKISKQYLHMDDHQLEAAVVDSFGLLKPRAARTGGLMRHIVSTILSEYPDLLPRDFLSTLEGLLEIELAAP